jgi:hypothetical protein
MTVFLADFAKRDFVSISFGPGELIKLARIISTCCIFDNTII